MLFEYDEQLECHINIFKYALFDLFCAHFRQENMLVDIVHNLHENAILLVSTLQVLEGLLCT